MPITAAELDRHAEVRSGSEKPTCANCKAKAAELVQAELRRNIKNPGDVEDKAGTAELVHAELRGSSELPEPTPLRAGGNDPRRPTPRTDAIGPAHAEDCKNTNSPRRAEFSTGGRKPA